MSTASQKPIETRLFINGEWETIDLVNPATSKLVAKVQIASKADVDKAADAAQAAFPAWSALTGKQRAQYIRKFQEKLAEANEELHDLEIASMGKARSTLAYEVVWANEYLETLAGQAEAVYGDSSLNQAGHLNLTLRQPYGVVAGIIPWNLGTPMWLWKVGPAIAAGNTIILKSSEKSPLLSLGLAKVIAAAGFPPGVINIISGAGPTGGYLSAHPLIRKISFTGSTATGRKVQQAAADSNLKVVTLELGGKSPTIVFADADFKNAVETVVLSSLVNVGQVCTANTRVYGDPTNINTVIGTVADALQVKSVTGLIEIGKTEGKLAIGGDADGAYVHPTIFTDVADNSQINTKEVFGPVMVFHTFKDEAEVIKRANDTEYGLYASVFTKDIDRAIRVAKQLEAGMVGINTASPTLHYDVPFGGWKQSGYGREMGRTWVESWTQVKTLYIKTASL
ncbi:hypothetical protein BS47DRAFT_1375719 [Hydnum rufescens UP504]|uniref:Aldehyde dehydrogenase domain-containing protein n=1 Tax=Hydnum rufescens UP504 TaxID=1448309 RepID=A0A9P6B3T6_9AGAM|nr:hypothetical protein BS47DRAFT_1375719 [Hydnum rufescens UP504]